ncbi:hypothetical protein KJ671_01780 [Patescibacteria group bacterium]|nr:hypothetical protein [Patescibacteria group bacterium]
MKKKIKNIIVNLVRIYKEKKETREAKIEKEYCDNLVRLTGYFDFPKTK